MKRRLRPLLFSPRLAGWLPRRMRGVVAGHQPKPFWGIVRASVGGPAVRTRRMIAEFGNHCLVPNVIYAQSGWNTAELASAVAFRAAGRAPLVFNQNGWYYPGWYGGDWRAANAAIVAAQKAADVVLFQSRFCLEAGQALTGYTPSNYHVLHNAVPQQQRSDCCTANDGRSVWLSAVFTPDTEHVLRPAIEAINILRKRHMRAPPRLLLAGRIDSATGRSDWFRRLEADIVALETEGGLERLGEYRPTDLPRLLARADVALHLKYKDPCPSAVIERMSFGLPHVFSNSGGTPELIGQAGVAMNVEDTWHRQVPVDARDLADAIDWALANRRQLSELARDTARSFSWEAYVARHRGVFSNLLETFA